MKPMHFSIMGEDGIKRTWYTERLWAHSAGLPIRENSIESFSALDRNTWFFSKEPTCRVVAEHAKRINEASLEYPVILSAEGWVTDGMHRICKALVLGIATVNVVQFSANPTPDEVERAVTASESQR